MSQSYCDLFGYHEAMVLRWLADEMIPAGKLSLLFRRLKIGKSAMSLYIASAVSNGRQPFCDKALPSSLFDAEHRTLIYSSEDDWNDAIAVRFKMMNANMANIAPLRSQLDPKHSFDWDTKRHPNGDGLLSEDEFTVVMPRERRRDRAEQASRDSQSDAHTGPNRREGRLPMRGQAFADIDTDGDGQLSKVELLAQIDDLADFDADGDGALNRREMCAARQGQDSSERKRGEKSAQLNPRDRVCRVRDCCDEPATPRRDRRVGHRYGFSMRLITGSMRVRVRTLG